MTDSKSRAVEAATAGPGEKRSASRPALAKASESGDPAVQKLLGDIYTAQQNGDDTAGLEQALAELGVRVNLEHVFAKVTTVANDLGYPITVSGGSHWLADDPLVVAHPDLFTRDCRYGLSFSGDPPQCLSVPPDEDEPEPDGLPQRRARQAATR